MHAYWGVSLAAGNDFSFATGLIASWLRFEKTAVIVGVLRQNYVIFFGGYPRTCRKWGKIWSQSRPIVYVFETIERKSMNQRSLKGK